MITETALAKELASLKDQLGERINNRPCVPIDSGHRQDMFRTLINTLKIRYSMVEEDFDHPMLLRLILQASVNPNSEKRKGWSQAVTDDWYRSLATEFPKEFIKPDLSQDTAKLERKSNRTEYVDLDPRLEKDNPVDRTIFEGLPPVDSKDDENFLKQMEEAIGGDDE